MRRRGGTGLALLLAVAAGMAVLPGTAHATVAGSRPQAITDVDTEPPSAATMLRATGTGSDHTLVSWQPATDNVGVVAYRVFRAAGLGPPILYATTTGLSQTIEGLAPLTLYHFNVEAVDAAGNSSRSLTLTILTPEPVPTPQSCRVSYTVFGTWEGGFVAQATLTNTGLTSTTAWLVLLRFSGPVQVTSVWNATLFRTFGADYFPVQNAAYNATLAPGNSVYIGFLGTTGGDQRLIDATANGVACAID